jgi:hypothetical protein
LGLFSLVACGGGDGLVPAGSDQSALSDETQDGWGDPGLSRKATEEALAGIPKNGKECRDLALVERLIKVNHLDVDGNEEPNIQETGAHANVVFYGANEVRTDATVVATVVGQTPAGHLYGNHNYLLLDGTMRSLRDDVALTPTNDPCVFDADIKMNFYDATGRYAGLSGGGVAHGQLNFCQQPGKVYIYGRLCKAQ